MCGQYEDRVGLFSVFHQEEIEMSRYESHSLLLNLKVTLWFVDSLVGGG